MIEKKNQLNLKIQRRENALFFPPLRLASTHDLFPTNKLMLIKQKKKEKKRELQKINEVVSKSDCKK